MKQITSFVSFCILLYSHVVIAATGEAVCDNLAKCFAELGVKHATHALRDFSALRDSSSDYFVADPETLNDVTKIVKFAYHHDIPIRVYGNGHAENGSSLPKSKELLLKTSHLNTVTFNKKGQVVVGAGIPIVIARDYVVEHSGYTIPVTNNGGVGPSVGGFVAAGGIGLASQRYGGYWNHVLAVTLVTGNGDVLNVTPRDALFPWLFGSMGQFGVVVSVTLELIPQENVSDPSYPLGLTRHVEFQREDYFKQDHNPLFWLSVFATPDRIDEVIKHIVELQSKFEDSLEFIPYYHWKIRNNKFVPPLIFKQHDFDAAGIMFVVPSKSSKDDVFRVSDAFTAMVKKYNYKRYIQTEIPGSPDLYQSYFGSEIYDQFLAYKKKYDPKMLFGKGTVFKS